jgi:uncharacterized membrane protein
MASSLPPTAASASGRTRTVVATSPLPVLVLTGALMVASALFKSACIDASHNYPWTCYSDILELFTSRNVAAHVFPYIHGHLVNGAPADTYEYPVLTGVFIWFSGLFASTRGQYLLVSTLLLTPCAVYVAAVLHPTAGRRALLWAASPALVLYGLHNWDLLAVASTLAALRAWSKDRTLLAGGLLAVGTCLKIYPALFLLPIAADLLHRRQGRRAVELLGLAVGGIALINLPFVLINAAGWATTYRFQQQRAADASSNSIWFWGHDALPLETPQLNLLLLVLVTASVLVALAVGSRRAAREGAYPVLPVCGAVLVAFLALNKVASPQYTLWILPFFALLRLRVGWWVAYLAADALVYVGIFRWFTDLGHGRDFGLAKQALVVGVWVKASLQVVLYVLMVRAQGVLPSQSTQRPDVNVSTISAISGAEAAT